VPGRPDRGGGAAGGTHRRRRRRWLDGRAPGVAPDLVEAYLGLGRTTDAADLAERYAAVTPQPDPPPTAALVARCRGLTVAGDEAAVEAFQAALAAHAQAPDAFEAARTRLLYGARLRRAGRRVAAREQLRVALDAFTAMDLTAWAQRAADELAATGATARPRRPLASEPLTSQETRVALLVARGLPNREIAAALFLSPKTVEHHLASVSANAASAPGLRLRMIKQARRFARSRSRLPLVLRCSFASAPVPAEPSFAGLRLGGGLGVAIAQRSVGQ
jgi:DNA-binding NarL/FixJ family response regulator